MLSKKVAQEEQNTKTQKQTKLFSKQSVDQPQKPTKTKSKLFIQNSPTAKTTNQTHTHLWKYGTGGTPKQLQISSWNVDGIRAVMNKEQLQNYLYKVNPDILCLNQTKINYEVYQKNPIIFPCYNYYWNFCKGSKVGYSGTAIFTKYLPLSVTQDLPGKPNHSRQGRTLTLEFKQFYLVTSYVPSSGQKLDSLTYRVQDWDKCFQEYCNELKKKKTTIICGNLNVCHKEIDIAWPEKNENTAGFTKQERDSFTKFLQNGWIDTYRQFHPNQVKYSWWSRTTNYRAHNIGRRLDYFLVDKQSVSIVKESLINNRILGSDHCPIELEIKFK